ncbi:MAG: TCP-1/cpn60 chaperonin family protein, partial [Bacillota bacterium]|nr:TCP-1/cpn60 chaperonin family protein [Bacillota bacterium]
VVPPGAADLSVIAGERVVPFFTSLFSAAVQIALPAFGALILADIAMMTGATFVAKDLGMEIKDVTVDFLGQAKKVVVTKDATTLIDGAGNRALIGERVQQIKKQMENATSEYDKKKYAERLGKLSNGVAVVKVGATTETELKEKKLKIEDALNATKAAVAEGIVIGGGAVLVEIYNEIRTTLKSDENDVQKGINVVLESLSAPVAQIAENAGYDPVEIVEKHKNAKPDVGFNALTGTWVDMFKAGIVDPTKVTRSAVLNAASIAALFITTEAGVAALKEDKAAPVMPSPDMY